MGVGEGCEKGCVVGARTLARLGALKRQRLRAGGRGGVSRLFTMCGRWKPLWARSNPKCIAALAHATGCKGVKHGTRPSKRQRQTGW